MISVLAENLIQKFAFELEVEAIWGISEYSMALIDVLTNRTRTQHSIASLSMDWGVNKKEQVGEEYNVCGGLTWKRGDEGEAVQEDCMKREEKHREGWAHETQLSMFARTQYKGTSVRNVMCGWVNGVNGSDMV